MEWIQDISQLKRTGSFAFPVRRLFLRNQRSINFQIGPMIQEDFEVCIRLDSSYKWCDDIINGEPQHLAFPNIAWKRPGEMITTYCKVGSVLAFSYDKATMRRFFDIGLEPLCNCMHFELTPDCERLILEIRKLIYRLYNPGVADQIDWGCFQLYKKLLMAPPQECAPMENVMRNISMWLQLHHDESVNMTELARRNGMSRAKFYSEWRKVFALSPTQYQMDCKLMTAAKLLEQTKLSIAAIVRDVHFSGLYAFHRKFHEKFGMTPAQYRKRNFPDVE